MESIHIVADSISMHYGPYLERYIKPFFHYSRKESTIGDLVNPEGQNGCDSKMVLNYLNKCVDQKMRWQFLIINCGLHDIRFANGGHQTDINIYRSNLFKILKIANKISNNIIWLRTTPVIDELHNTIREDIKRYNCDVEMYNKVADIVMNDNGFFVIDLYAFCKCLGGAETYKDHIHFTDEARNLQGAFISGYLISHLFHINGINLQSS